MYPDRATFLKMVDNEPDLSGSGRETLLTLYEGPLRFRQILEIINSSGGAAKEGTSKERKISESALRKRLEVLIHQGIISRAGSELTNPYYYIRRPWLFNNYILVKCRDQPSSGLQDLTILLHELSRQNAAGKPSLPPPRIISAIGERTERGHQIVSAYDSFQKILGDKNAVGDYLEAIYSDIYEGRVPESDIDGFLAQDFLRFVAMGEPEEHEVRFFLWYANFFHMLDQYQNSQEAFLHGQDLAAKTGIPWIPILSDARISLGHILLHLNDLKGAKNTFLETYNHRDAGPLLKAKSQFGAGEVELFHGETGPTSAPARFSQALRLCEQADPKQENPDIQELRGDILRRTGTVHRISGRFTEALSCYDAAAVAYKEDMFRGLASLIPERAELARASAFGTSGAKADEYLAKASSLYEEAKAVSLRIRSINKYAHALLGECELARIAHQKFGKPLPRDLEAKYGSAFEIFCQIFSDWGITQVFISEALLYHASADKFPGKYADTAEKLDQAERLGKNLGLKTELALINRIKSHTEPALERNPLTFL